MNAYEYYVYGHRLLRIVPRKIIKVGGKVEQLSFFSGATIGIVQGYTFQFMGGLVRTRMYKRSKSMVYMHS